MNDIDPDLDARATARAGSARRGSRRRPKSEEHRLLGELLQQARERAGRTTREMGFSSGHVSNVEGGYVTPSRTFIAAYVELGVDRAAAEALLDAIHRKGAVNGTGQVHEITATTSGADVRGHYRVEAYDVEFTFDGHGAIVKVLSEVTISATSPEVRFYYTGHAPGERGEAEPPKVEARGGASLERINASPVGAFEIFFRLDRCLRPGDPPHTLAYEIELPGGELDDPGIHYFAPPGARRHRLVCRFQPPAVPEQLWWVAAPDGYLASVPDPAALLVPAGTHRYEHSFERLLSGWCYGFTWTWPADLRRQAGPTS